MPRWGALLCLLALGACRTEPDYRRVEAMPHEWTVESEVEETQVSRALPYEDVKAYTERMKASGWRVLSYEDAGEFLPQRYVVVMSRPR